MNTSRLSLTPLRPGEQRKVTCPAAGQVNGGFKVTRSHPFRVERRRVPEPTFRPDGAYPTSRDATAPRPRGGQMEIFLCRPFLP